MIGIDARVEAMKAYNSLDKLEKELTARQLYKVIGQRLLKWVNDNFKAQGLEHKWAPLSPNTIASRRAGNIKNSQGATRFKGRRVVGGAINLSKSKPLQDTGRLRQSFFADDFHDRLIVGTQSQIAELHHEGRGPFTIKPKSGRFLYFMTANGPVFAKSVRHPGIPKRPLLPSDALVERIGSLTALAEIKRMELKANKGTA